MPRKYKSKTKLYTEVTIETAMIEVKNGAILRETADKYHMSRFQPGYFQRKKQVSYFPVTFICCGSENLVHILGTQNSIR